MSDDETTPSTKAPRKRDIDPSDRPAAIMKIDGLVRTEFKEGKKPDLHADFLRCMLNTKKPKGSGKCTKVKVPDKGVHRWEEKVTNKQIADTINSFLYQEVKAGSRAPKKLKAEHGDKYTAEATAIAHFCVYGRIGQDTDQDWIPGYTTAPEGKEATDPEYFHIMPDHLLKLCTPAEHTFNVANVDGDRLTKYLNYEPGYPQAQEYTPKHGMKLKCLVNGKEIQFRCPHNRFYLASIFATYKYKLAQKQGLIGASPATPVVTEEVEEDAPTPPPPKNPGYGTTPVSDPMDVVEEEAPPVVAKEKKVAKAKKHNNGATSSDSSKLTPAQLLEHYTTLHKEAQEMLNKYARMPEKSYFHPTPVPPKLGEQIRQCVFPEQLDLQPERLQALMNALKDPGYAGPAFDSIDLINCLLYVSYPLDMPPQFFIHWLNQQSAGSGFQRSDTNHGIVMAHLRGDRDETRSGIDRELKHLDKSNNAIVDELQLNHPHALSQMWVLRQFILAIERIYAIRPVTVNTNPAPRCVLTGKLIAPGTPCYALDAIDYNPGQEVRVHVLQWITPSMFAPPVIEEPPSLEPPKKKSKHDPIAEGVAALAATKQSMPPPPPKKKDKDKGKGKEKERDLPKAETTNLAKTEKKAFVGMLPPQMGVGEAKSVLLGTPLFLHLIHQAFSEPAGPADVLMQRVLSTTPDTTGAGLQHLLDRNHPKSIHQYPGAAAVEATPGFQFWHKVFLAMCKQFIGPFESAGMEARKNNIPLVLEETLLAGKSGTEYYQALGWLLSGLDMDVAQKLEKFNVVADQPLSPAHKAAARALFLPLSHLQ